MTLTLDLPDALPSLTPALVIRTQRVALRLSQRALAEQARVDRSIVSRLESGLTPSRQVRDRLVAVLGIDPWSALPQ